MAKAPKSNPTIQAVRLLGKWTTLARGHVFVGGGGCSCGVGGASLAIQDFEQQILHYLGGKYPAVAESATVPDLLRAIAARPAHDDANRSLALLTDLERTLESFEELHRAR